MSNPKISIIVPIYNVEKYLRKCIDSVLSQTLTNFELILVNDGSPDNCGSICNEYAKRDSRIRVIHKENNGLSSARNAGIKIAKGKYIGFIDSDDYINENMYEILYKNAELYSSDVVVCDVMEVYENKYYDLKQHNTTKYRIEHFTNIEVLNQLYLSTDKSINPMGRGCERWIYAVNKLYKKSLFDSLEYDEGRIYEDEFIVHKIYFKSTKVTSLTAKLYYYVQRPNSIMNSPYSIKRFDRIYALKERADFFKAVRQNNLHEKAFWCFLEVLLWNYKVARLELNNVDNDLRNLKKTLDKSIISLIRNPYISWRQKVMVLFFIISPTGYFFVSNRKIRRLFKAN
ncbi:glycosyltransferase [Bacillus sp. MM2020_1]|nr:glycosyltransferase [Bacillus sp. MM2020_1]